MKRSNFASFASVLIAFSATILAAQQSSQQDPYQGTSRPPANDTIVADEPQAPAQAPAKPAPGKPVVTTPTPAPSQAPSQASPTETGTDQQPVPAPAYHPPAAGQDASQQQPADAGDDSADGSDGGTVSVQPMPSPVMAQTAPAPLPEGPVLTPRMETYNDPDGDIVHPEPLRPGELGEGTMIRVKLLDRLSTALTERGEAFHSRVATDVLQGGQVIIPAGTEIDGTVVEVSSGHPGSSGSMRLRPEYIVMGDGTRYRIYADVTGTPGSRTHVVGEGVVKPDSRWKRDGIEYGGAVGVGVVAGAAMGGPAGALAGGLIGAGAITAHLLVSHTQATLEPGTTLLLELTGPLQMTPINVNGN